jgi:hypothetical protein
VETDTPSLSVKVCLFLSLSDLFSSFFFYFIFLSFFLISSSLLLSFSLFLLFLPSYLPLLPPLIFLFFLLLSHPTDGTVYTWGSGKVGVLGHNGDSDLEEPMQLVFEQGLFLYPSLCPLFSALSTRLFASVLGFVFFGFC